MGVRKALVSPLTARGDIHPRERRPYPTTILFHGGKEQKEENQSPESRPPFPAHGQLPGFVRTSPLGSTCHTRPELMDGSMCPKYPEARAF